MFEVIRNAHEVKNPVLFSTRVKRLRCPSWARRCIVARLEENGDAVVLAELKGTQEHTNKEGMDRHVLCETWDEVLDDFCYGDLCNDNFQLSNLDKIGSNWLKANFFAPISKC